MRRWYRESKEHLKETEWSCLYHLRHSITQSNRLIFLAIKSYLHGFFPWMFKSDGPLTIYKIYREIRKMHHIQKMERKGKL